jgi:hypothetical protein
MPDEKEGSYRAYVIKTHSIGIERVVWESEILRCRKQAYLVSRFMALIFDWFVIDFDWGVMYAVEKCSS